MDDVYIIKPNDKIKMEYIVKPKTGYVNKEKNIDLYTYRNKTTGEK